MLLAAPFLLWALGAGALDDPGEGMHAEIARELARSGDPFALTLSGVRYVDKPPLLYALIALASRTVGESELAARLPSALAALVAIGATAWLGARLTSPAYGVLAGVALLGSVGFFAYGRYVRPETLLVATLAVGFALMLTGLVEERRGRVIAGLITFGAAGLAKDPLAALLPPMAIGVALALGGRARPFRRWLPAWGVAGGLALALGWWVLAEIRTPGFLWYTVVDNHLLNVARARQFPDEDVPLGALEFLAVAVVGAAPWALAAAVSVADLVRRRAWRIREELPWVALAVWSVGVLGVTALSPFRLPHYGLPAYPMLALLAARAWRSTAARWLVPLHAALFVVLGGVAVLAWASDAPAFFDGLMATTDVATRKSGVTGASPSLPPWAAFRPLVGWTAVTSLVAGVALAAVTSARSARGVALGAVAVALGAVAVLPAVAAALALVSTHRAVKPLALEVRHRWRAGDTLVHEGPIENSGALEWYSGYRPVVVDGRRSVLGFGATLDGASVSFWDADRLTTAWAAPGRVWLVTARAEPVSLAPRLPGARLVAAAGGRRLYVNRDE